MTFFRVIMEVEEPGSDIRELEEVHAVFAGVSQGRLTDQENVLAGQSECYGQ
jgi:hypothetical protein